MATPLKFYGNTPQKIIAKCVLISAHRFSVELSGFSEEVTTIFKTVPSRIYDPKTRIWNFSITHYNLLMNKLQLLQGNGKLSVERLPTYIIKMIQAPKKEVEIDFEKLDPVLSCSLMSFQVEGLRFGVEKEGRCFIGDDMGLGKTFTALAIANYYKNNWPLLIVTTASMKAVWEETITDYMPTIPIMHVQYMVSSKDYIGDSQILIVSHDMMSRCCDKLLDQKFGVVIIDESHILKNFKSKGYQAALSLSKMAKRIILLSGTPALSRPSELYTQLTLIDKNFFHTFTQFAIRYCDGKHSNYGLDASGKSNLQELEVVLSKKFMIRRTKEDLIKSLPKKKQEIVRLFNHKTGRREMDDKDRELMKILGERYASNKGADKHSILLSFFAETARIKIPEVCVYILKMLDGNDKFLVFAHHQVMLNAIEDTIKAKNIKYVRIDGNTTSDQRKFFISKFQLNDEVRCALLSITATNAGITLTAAKLVIFAELHWNPTILSQAEARAHRIGQEDEVTVQYLVAPSTADDYIWSLLQEKQKTLNEVGLSKDNFDGVVERVSEKNPNGPSTSTTGCIEDYFTPEKKRKVEKTSTDDVFNDGLDEMLLKHTELLLDDGMDEVLCSIDF